MPALLSVVREKRVEEWPGTLWEAETGKPAPDTPEYWDLPEGVR